MRVLQCLRAPLGGLFRHVDDLTRGLTARGIEVGVVCDDGDYGELAGRRLDALGDACTLGLHRIKIPRHAGFHDLTALGQLRRLSRDLDIDIIHGHGAKGGAHARLAARTTGAKALYTPHGGSLHYTSATPAGFAYVSLERLLRRLGAPVLFESAYSAGIYEERIGPAPAGSATIHNGLDETEFMPVSPRENAADIVFLGEFRTLKGPFVLAEALEILASQGRHLSAEFIGRGPDEAALKARLDEIAGCEVTMTPPMPARDAFARGQLLVVPSLAESLPYVVLEAAAAGTAMITTRVGGIPEIFGPMSDALIAPGSSSDLAAAIARALDDPRGTVVAAERLRDRVRAEFSLSRMVDAIAARYDAALAPASISAISPLPRHGH